MTRERALPIVIASLVLAMLPIGCGGASSTPLTPEQAKAIVGEDPDYLPNAGAASKAAKKR